MNVTDFLDYLKSEYSEEKLENNENNFFEYFFYYKRNIRDFLTAFKTYTREEQKQIILFLLQLYPLSDSFLAEIFREMQIALNDEITFDTINYITNAFIEEIGDLKIDLGQETEKNLQKTRELRDIIELNENKMKKLLATKQDLIILKEKETNISKEIKALESGDISSLKEEVKYKTRKLAELKNEKQELNKQYEKLNRDLNDLEKYSDYKQKADRCRDIIKGLVLPKDYTDKIQF